MKIVTFFNIKVNDTGMLNISTDLLSFVMETWSSQ